MRSAVLTLAAALYLVQALVYAAAIFPWEGEALRLGPTVFLAVLAGFCWWMRGWVVGLDRTGRTTTRSEQAIRFGLCATFGLLANVWILIGLLLPFAAAVYGSRLQRHRIANVAPIEGSPPPK